MDRHVGIAIGDVRDMVRPPAKEIDGMPGDDDLTPIVAETTDEGAEATAGAPSLAEDLAPGEFDPMDALNSEDDVNEASGFDFVLEDELGGSGSGVAGVEEAAEDVVDLENSEQEHDQNV